MADIDLALGQIVEAMFDCFTESPDYTPYHAEPNNIPLDEINPALEGLAGNKRYWAERSLEQDLDNYDRIDEDTFNRIIWHAMKGYDRPYPEVSINMNNNTIGPRI